MKKIFFITLCFFIVGGCLHTQKGLWITTATPTGGTEEIPATLFKPEGPGPFPAIVIMHDCSGLGPRSSGAPGRWAKELLANGYVVILPDSFSTRGHAGGVCTDPSPSRATVDPYRRARDAYAALAYVQTLPFVDGNRVGLMGGSHGGSTTLATMVAQNHQWLPEKGFAAAVALYPACAISMGDWHVEHHYGSGGSRLEYLGAYNPIAPVMILIGEKDDWTPAEPCRLLAEYAQAEGYPVTIKIYPWAHHSFDSDRPVRYVPERVNANSRSGRGATTGGDPKAWADSIDQVTHFFGQYLLQGTN